jgi:SanA protein
MAARRLVRVVVTGLALAVGVVVVPNVWVAHAEHARIYRAVEDVPQRSVAIVPGTSVSHGQPGWCLTDRLTAALALYRAGRVKAIVVSGNDTQRSPEVSVMRRRLTERGVPAADIWSDPAGSRTRETMLNAAHVLGVKNAIICTQERYLARAIYLAENAGIDAVGLALSTDLPRTPRAVGEEILKTTLATVESYARPSSLTDMDSGQQLLALR